MDKRYQVFVSSTFADLKKAREFVIQTLMKLDCIPAGMELFPAADEDQFDFIKKVIDDCDYYILIIGGRYGSLTSSGISYTEAEYDYAKDKGLKVLAFIHKNPENLKLKQSEQKPALVKKLNAFREKASSGRLVQFWSQPKDLPGQIALSMAQAMKSYPATGWVRGDTAGSTELLTELNDVRKRNESLHEELESLAVNSGKRRVDAFHDLRSRAHHRIVVTGIGLTAVVQYDSDSLKQQAENVPIDLLMLSPDALERDNNFSAKLEHFLDISDFSEKVRSSYDKLKAICMEWNSDPSHRYSMRLRVYDTIPTNSMVVIDPGADTAEALIEFFMFQSGAYRPRINARRNTESGRAVFDRVWADFGKLWSASQEVVGDTL